MRRLFAAESTDFFLLLGTTLFLVVFGLVMVLSSSSVTSFTENDNVFLQFSRQGLFALLGVPIMLIASRMPVSFWKRWAPWVMGVGVVLQLLVLLTPLGEEVNGNRNWLRIAEGFTVQPSEVTKLGLVLWLASVLSSRIDQLDDLRRLAIPLLPVAGLAIGLVLMGHDLGTALIMVSIVFGVLFFAGVKLRLLAIPLVAGAVLLPLTMLTGNSRGQRISVWLSQCSDSGDYAASCWQTVHGWWALAAGGVFGVGLGNSKAKWSWLPEAENDFIFAIIGEEFGFVGAILVLALFVVLAVTFVRIIRHSDDPFVRLAVGAVLLWIIGQAFVNIAVVLGLLPVLGVPLPLMSAGGTALITSLFAIGIVLSFARHTPEPDAATRSRAARSGASRAASSRAASTRPADSSQPATGSRAASTDARAASSETRSSPGRAAAGRTRPADARATAAAASARRAADRAAARSATPAASNRGSTGARPTGARPTGARPNDARPAPRREPRA